MSLSDKQSIAVEKLRRYKVGALFPDPGWGKTRSACALVRDIPCADFVLYLAPYQSINRSTEAIPHEVELSGGVNAPIKYIGVESLSNSDRLYLDLRRELGSARRPVVIVDESLKIKNFEAKRTRRVIELGKLAEYKLILNGTPLSRNLLDLWAQMEFLSPKILKMSRNRFKKSFCEYVTIDKRIGSVKHSFILSILQLTSSIELPPTIAPPSVYPVGTPFSS